MTKETDIILNSLMENNQLIQDADFLEGRFHEEFDIFDERLIGLDCNQVNWASVAAVAPFASRAPDLDRFLARQICRVLVTQLTANQLPAALEDLFSYLESHELPAERGLLERFVFGAALGVLRQHYTPDQVQAIEDERLLTEAAYNKQFVGDNFAGFKIEFRPETFSHVLVSTWEELRGFMKAFPGEVTHVCTRVSA